MALKTYKLGELILIIDERNTFGLKNFYGININKDFMPTVANTEGLDETKYKVVRKNRFVYSGMQTGRDECIRIGMYLNDNPIIISPAYITFEISAVDEVIPLYFFMRFLSKEMDRLGWFHSDSSIRSNLDWADFCDLEISLPPISIQQKYVDIYKAMVANQQAYERGLEDLKLVCDGYIEDLRRKMPCEAIGRYIEQCNAQNDNLQYGIDDVRGISIEKRFIETKADMEGVSLKPYAIVAPGEFGYVTVTSRNGDKISIALNDSNNHYICSSSYIVFRISDKSVLLPRYLAMFLARNEFDRYARFHSWGSARETFDWDEMCNIKIPIPSIKVQESIVSIYNAYIERKSINERLKAQIRDICPILIKGSIEEASI